MVHRALALSLVSGLCLGSNALAGPVCGIFVSPGGVDAPGGGLTTNDPVQSIAFALTRAQEEMLDCVFVQAGTYKEIVTLTDGVTIDGGYDLNWERDFYGQFGHEVRLVGASDPGTGQFLTVVASNLPSGATLRNLVIDSPDAMGTMKQSGLNSVGVYTNNVTLLTLSSVRIECGNGADGGEGSGGADAPQSFAPSGGNGENGQTTLVCSTVQANGGGGAINGIVGSASRGGNGGRGGASDTDCGFPPDFDARPGQNGTNANVASGGFGQGGNGGSSNCGAGFDGSNGRVADGVGGPGGNGGLLSGSVWVSLSGGGGTIGEHGGGGHGGGHEHSCISCSDLYKK